MVRALLLGANNVLGGQKQKRSLLSITSDEPIPNIQLLSLVNSSFLNLKNFVLFESDANTIERKGNRQHNGMTTDLGN